jgi:hypothetical protein
MNKKEKLSHEELTQSYSTWGDKLLQHNGFDNFLDISLSQIYNTTGVWCTLCLKN